MSSISTISNTDNGATSLNEINTNFSNLNAGKVEAPASNTDSKIPQWNGSNTKILKDGLLLDTDGTLAGNLDTSIPSQKAVKTYADAITTAQNLKNSGWIAISDSWTYASATTITVPTGAASLYQKGDKIKLTQTTVKYFYVIGVANTVLTITGGSGYTLTNEAISAISVSHIENPVGFPQWMTWTPTLTNGADLSAYDSARFRVVGSSCHLIFDAENKSVTTSGICQISVPVPFSTVHTPLMCVVFVSATIVNSSQAVLDTVGYIDLTKGSAASWIGNETGVYIRINGIYEI